MVRNFLNRHAWKVAGLAIAMLVLAFFPHAVGALALPFVTGTVDEDSQPVVPISEATLIAGIDMTLYTSHVVFTTTLTAARLVANPTNMHAGQRITFVFTQSAAAGTGHGRHNITWGTAFKGVAGWSNANNGPGGNNIGKGSVSSITFITPDGVSLYPVGAQNSWNS